MANPIFNLYGTCFACLFEPRLRPGDMPANPYHVKMLFLTRKKKKNMHAHTHKHAQMRDDDEQNEEREREREREREGVKVVWGRKMKWR